MFGSEPDKNSAQPPAAPAPPVISPAQSMAGQGMPPENGMPVPAPDTEIRPTGPPSTQPSTSFLDNGPPVTGPVKDNSNSFLATGSGAPKMPSFGNSRSEPAAVPPAVPDELIKIKQEALHSLEPLIDKLDQTPEERFKTLMMMIQASDNPQYLDEAYEAANGIQDEKDKAQALLDVVNEINYFTQNQNGEAKD